MRSIRSGLAGIALALSGAGVAAQERECILVKVSAETVQQATDSRGRKTRQLLSAQKVNPGEVMLYTVSAANICDRPIQHAQIAIPVPEHVTYVARSAVGPGAEAAFSVDGGFHYSSPELLTVLSANGEQRLASPAQYTHIRWVMSKALKPGAVAFARFRAVFER